MNAGAPNNLKLGGKKKERQKEQKIIPSIVV